MNRTRRIAALTMALAAIGGLVLFFAQYDTRRGGNVVCFDDIEGLPSARAHCTEMNEHTHWVRPMDSPVWRSADDADHMLADDAVLGLIVDGTPWAIPWWIMKNHHVANLKLGGRSLMIAFCEVCSSAAAYRPFLDGRLHRFRLAGLYNGTILISDLETGSFWSPFTGEALHGPLKGASLERIPLFLSSWGDWSHSHARTRVVFGTPEMREGHGRSTSPGAAGIDRNIKDTLVREIDERLAHNALVLGVETETVSRAYPIVELTDGELPLGDEVGGEEIVIFHLPETYIAVAFSRRVGDDLLDFELMDNGEIRDIDTGSTWNLAGLSVRGPLVGTSLTFVSSGVEEWYIWAAYHPETGIFGRAALETADPITLEGVE